MGVLTIYHQDVKQSCDDCDETFDVSRGSVYDDGEGIGIYIAGMHQCGSGTMVHLAIAIRKAYEDLAETCAVSLHVWPTESDFEMSVIEPQFSPWKNESNLGRMLEREEALGLAQIETFFHIADHITLKNPKINDYLSTT